MEKVRVQRRSRGPDGAAIRRNSGFTVNISNSGTLSGSTNATGVL